MKFETLFKYCSSYYAELEKLSNIEEVRGVDVRVFRGSITEVYRDLGYSYTYYGDIRRALVRAGCFTMLQRGTSSQQSIFVLHHPPDYDRWAESSEDLTAPLEDAMLRQQIDDLDKRIGGMNIVNAFADIQSQVDELAKRVRQLEGTDK